MEGPGDPSVNSFTILVSAKDREESREDSKRELEIIYGDYSHFLRSFAIMGIKEMGQ